MLYTVRKRLNPLNRTEEPKFYACPSWNGEVNIREISEEISHSSSINSADVKAVLESFLFHLPQHLMNGDTVRLDGFGLLGLSFHAKGQTVEKAVSVADISNVHINFRPSPEIKAKIKKTKFNRR